MAQNTAMQEAINKFDNLNPYQGFTAQEVVNILLELLPKERQDIQEAHDKGMVRYCQWEPDRHGNEAPSGSDYFIQTFTQNK